MSSFLLEFEGNRNDYINLIKNSEEDIVFKFTAEWCKPCKSIKNFLEEYFEE